MKGHIDAWRRRAVVAAVLGTVLADAAVARQQQPPLSPQVLRTTSTLVPLDVRVLDRQGRAVTDLRETDFVVKENGVVQRIAHFSADTLQPLSAEAAREPLTPARTGTDPIVAAKRRVILLVMGRGTLEHPFNAVTAAMDFVRTKLMPQDYVAVMAYNRATDFTTDHQTVIQVLDRFNAKHENIDRRFQITLGGLPLLYGDRRIPASIQRDIDRIFEPAGEQVRNVSREPEAINPKARVDVFKDMEDLLYDLKHSTGVPACPQFDKFIDWILPTMHDAGSIHAGIEYLRFLEGEKRLIFVTEQGFSLPRTESDLRIAEAASAARVVIDTIHTGGVVAELPNDDNFSIDMFRRMSAMATIKILTDTTGGQRFTSVRPDEAFERIDRASRSGYLLGYYAADDKKDGRFRKIEVSVNRPSVTVHVRRGYYATDTPPAVERTRMMTDMRILTAAAVAERLTDVRVSVNVSTAKDAEGQWASAVSGRIDAKRLGWKVSDGRYQVTLELVIGAVDSKGLLVGEHRQPLVVTVGKEMYDKALTSGLSYSVSVLVTRLPSEVKVIVYDPTRDLLGSETYRTSVMKQ